jgi:hypothetical protein
MLREGRVLGRPAFELPSLVCLLSVAILLLTRVPGPRLKERPMSAGCDVPPISDRVAQSIGPLTR